MTNPAPTKDRITCHVLDTTTGRPARSLRVQLSSPPTTTDPAARALTSATVTSPVSGSGSSPAATATPTLSTAPKVFESLTDDDGRIKGWLPYSSATASGDVPVYTLDDVLGDIKGTSRWTLRFDVEGYWTEQGKECFFPEVVVVFDVKEGQGYHVPLLLGPYNYTTYRGS